MSRLKTLVRNEAGTPPLRGGHALCQGCGVPMVVRTIVDSIETAVVVVSATGCLEVATTRFPTTAWNVPWLHVAFENAAAVASGVETAHRALVKQGALSDEPITFTDYDETSLEFVRRCALAAADAAGQADDQLSRHSRSRYQRTIGSPQKSATSAAMAM